MHKNSTYKNSKTIILFKKLFPIYRNYVIIVNDDCILRLELVKLLHMGKQYGQILIRRIRRHGKMGLFI